MSKFALIRILQEYSSNCNDASALGINLLGSSSILQRSQDDTKLFHQLNFHFCFERNILYLRNMFKCLGFGQFLEVHPTSQEIVLFHDHGFVVLRFACSSHESSIVGSDSDVMAGEEAKCVSELGAYFLRCILIFSWFLLTRSFGDEY